MRYGSVEWGPDGGLYTVTDEGSDTLYLARLDPATGDLEPVRDDGKWNIDGVAVDDEHGLLVYSRNVDGYTELTLADVDGTSLTEYPLPDLPGDVAGGVSFGPAGDRLALSASGRGLNTNVFVVPVTPLREGRAATARQWTHAGTAGVPRETFVEPDLVRYETFDGRPIPAFYSVPAGVDRGEPGDTPVIVDIHGGPESQRRPSFTGLTQYFLSQGYAVFEPNVRGSTGYGKAYTHLDDVEKRMDAVQDIGAAVDWLATRPELDADRVVAKGGSYGGFMMLAAMTEYPDRWAAGVDAVGIANFVTFLENTGSWRRELREAEYGSLAEDRDLLERISPINRVEQVEAPLFVLHGANDPRVPVGEAEQVVEEVREQGAGRPWSPRFFDTLRRAGLVGEVDPAADVFEVGPTFLSYLHTCDPGDHTPDEADYAALEPFFDAELRAVTAHVLLPVGERATRHVLESYTSRSHGAAVDMGRLHATEVSGTGWLVVPVGEPAAWTDGDADALAGTLAGVRDADYRQTADLGRFLPDDEPYFVR